MSKSIADIKDLEEGIDYITLEDGAYLIVKAIQPLGPKALETQYERRNPRPKVPTYASEAAGGVVIEHEHDETTVETDEEKEMYAKYLQDKRAWETGLATLMMRFFVGEGTELVLSQERRDDWVQKMIMYGFIESEDELPKNKTERKILFLDSIGIKSPGIMQSIPGLVLRQTGVNPTDLESAERLF